MLMNSFILSYFNGASRTLIEKNMEICLFALVYSFYLWLWFHNKAVSSECTGYEMPSYMVGWKDLIENLLILIYKVNLCHIQNQFLCLKSLPTKTTFVVIF